MNRQVRQITEAAMMIAIVGVALLFNQQTGMLFDVYIYWFIAFPLMIYTAKHGLKKGVLPFIGMVILVLLFANMFGWIFGISSLLIGLGYGYGVRQKWGSGKLMMYTISLSLLSYFLSTFVFASFLGYNIMDEVNLLVEGLNQLMVYIPFELPIAIGDFALMASIVGLVGVGLLEGFFIHMMATLILPRFKINVPKFPTVYEMQLPKGFGYFSIATFILYTIMNLNVIVWSAELKNVIMFLYMICFIVNVVYGATVVLFLLAIYNKRKWIIFGWLGMFIPILNNGYMLLGVLDTMTLLKREILKQGMIERG